MTRDQWLTKCAQRLIDRGGLDAGDAAANAIECAKLQTDDNGTNPAKWDAPADAADEEMSHWDNDGGGPDGDEA